MDLLICGASARAAAFSALRAGLRPVCADLFADRDLSSLCPAHRISAEAYPQGLVDLSRSLPPIPWLYTGALENHPALVDELSRRHLLLGNDGPSLRAVRDPIRVAEALGSAGLACPRVRLDPASLPRDGSWLVKPLASGGGLGIAPYDGRAMKQDAVYYQERVEGPSFSALYVGRREAAELVGVTRQESGRPGAPFGYAGSLGPWPIGADERGRLESLGNVLAVRFSLVGLFGVDYILREGLPWPVEVNPRYTASVEVLELATGRSLLFRHLSACAEMGGPHPSFPRRAWERLCGRSASRGIVTRSVEDGVPTQSVGTRGAALVGKSILFAARTCSFLDEAKGDTRGPHSVPSIGDVPRSGTEFRPGEPVLTVFATGDTPAECRAKLDAQRREWEARLRFSRAQGSLTTS